MRALFCLHVILFAPCALWGCRARQQHREATRGRAGRAGAGGEEEEEEGVEGPEAGGQEGEEEDDDAEWYRREVGEEPGEPCF